MADFNMAANMYGLYPNLYNNQVALNDLTNLNLYAPMGSLYNPIMNSMMGMNGSIFGGMYPGMGMYPPMTGGSSYNYEDYYKMLQKHQDFMIDRQIKQQEQMRNADIKLNSPQEGVAKRAGYLHEKIMLNEQEQILNSYKQFKASVKELYGEASDEEISNRAATLYKQVNGTSITDDIRKHGNGSFTQGFLQTVTLGIADKKTAEENISELTGEPVGRTEKNKKYVGNFTGGAVIGGAAALSFKLLFKGIWAGLKNKPLVAATIAGVVGLTTAIATSKSS